MEVHVYKDINEVPQTWRTYKSARLNLSQINEIMNDAYEQAINEDQPDYGGAKQRFASSHHIEEGFWIEGVRE